MRARIIVDCLFSALALFVSSVFVSIYSTGSAKSAGHQGMELPMLARFYADFPGLGYVVLLVLVLAMTFAIWCLPPDSLVTRALVQLGWLMAFTWALGCILAWLLPQLYIGVKID